MLISKPGRWGGRFTPGGSSGHGLLGLGELVQGLVDIGDADRAELHHFLTTMRALREGLEQPRRDDGCVADVFGGSYDVIGLSPTLAEDEVVVKVFDHVAEDALTAAVDVQVEVFRPPVRWIGVAALAAFAGEPLLPGFNGYSWWIGPSVSRGVTTTITAASGRIALESGNLGRQRGDLSDDVGDRGYGIDATHDRIAVAVHARRWEGGDRDWGGSRCLSGDRRTGQRDVRRDIVDVDI
ncbi:hypothetical protein E4U23_006476 [Claviceps purpurea]|nr:hypothetical protein E4U23_006476 [Claviceps purpurea]